MTEKGLGWVEPPDFEHVDKYPALLMATGPDHCKRTLALPSRWRKFYDQGDTPRCVGYSASQERSLSERATYDPDWLYARCKERDGIPHVGGTYLRVAYDVLREVGHWKMNTQAPNLKHGVERNEWARSIDEIRHAIQAGKAVVIGTRWYSRMFRPEKRHGLYWLPKGGAELGAPRGGHAYLLHGVDDDQEAFLTPNTWGQADRDWNPGEEGWPITRVPYSLMDRLIFREQGEGVMVVDRKEITR